MRAKVLLVSDNPETARIWAYSLQQRDIEIIVAGSPTEALNRWAEDMPDLVVIDFHASHLDGVDLCRSLRAEAVNPILLLTPETGETHILKAYEAGADECVIKPISPLVFLAKVQSWLRRSWTVATNALETIQVGDIQLNPSTRQVVLRDGSVVRLSNLEVRLLHLLMRHPRQVFEPNTIIDRVWGYSGDGGVLKNMVYRLRRKIEPDPSQPRYIQTVRGRGYTFQPE